MANNSLPVWHRRRSLGLALPVLGIGLVCWFLPWLGGSAHAAATRPWSWIITLVLLLIFMVIAGDGITGRWDGVLIDQRNKMSLSRLQLVLWTALIVSALVTAAVSNIALGSSNALAIAVPPQVWIALGISASSLVGSPLILNQKTIVKPDDTQKDKTVKSIGQQEELPEKTTIANKFVKSGNSAASVTVKSVDSVGLVIVKAVPQYARWVDLFKGEETGNGAYLDMAKIQMFFFTLILVFAYAVNIGAMFSSTANPVTEFPPFDSSVVWLLGISHAGYLTSKVTPHSVVKSQIP